MDINTFAYERSGMTLERQKQGLETLFAYIIKHTESFDGLIDAILEAACVEEDYDGFGTEGLDI